MKNWPIQRRKKMKQLVKRAQLRQLRKMMKMRSSGRRRNTTTPLFQVKTLRRLHLCRLLSTTKMTRKTMVMMKMMRRTLFDDVLSLCFNV
ncbi:hypothetical protein LINPERPRIM_LOCUS13490 [Linum perenne]